MFPSVTIASVMTGAVKWWQTVQTPLWVPLRASKPTGRGLSPTPCPLLLFCVASDSNSLLLILMTLPETWAILTIQESSKLLLLHLPLPSRMGQRSFFPYSQPCCSTETELGSSAFHGNCYPFCWVSEWMDLSHSTGLCYTQGLFYCMLPKGDTELWGLQAKWWQSAPSGRQLLGTADLSPLQSDCKGH